MGQMLRPWKTILTLDLQSERAVFQQIADGIVSEILKGRLQPGTPLPGSRVLADDVGVNRKTVVLAYEQLIDEGWLSTAYKKGTFVSEKLPEVKRKDRKAGHQKTPATFSFNTMEVPASAPIVATGKKGIVFDDGLPDVRLAPMEELARACKRIFLQKTRWRLMGYGSEKGEETLRVALVAMLAHDRGLSFAADQICVTRGSQMALYLTAHTLLKPGDVVAIEDPGYFAAAQMFRQAGATIEPVPLDEQGIRTDYLEALCKRKKIKAVYVTPHHQFPTTVSMKADRRLALVALSNQYGFAIIEDDYDHEFHFGTRSLLPLASQEQAGNVIYISSLSKIVAPALRIGYVTGPPAFINALAALRKILDRQGDTVMENAVAELMESGIIRRHTRKAFAIYSERRAHMDYCLQQYLQDKVHYQLPEGGLAFWVPFTTPQSSTALAAALLQKGVQITATEPFYMREPASGALRLGYASLTPEEMEEGMQRIAGCIR